MKTQVYRNLDRPFTLLGIKGRYIVFAGATIIVSIMPARVTKKLSAMAGHATEIAFLVMYLRSF